MCFRRVSFLISQNKVLEWQLFHKEGRRPGTRRWLFQYRAYHVSVSTQIQSSNSRLKRKWEEPCCLHLMHLLPQHGMEEVETGRIQGWPTRLVQSASSRTNERDCFKNTRWQRLRTGTWKFPLASALTCAYHFQWSACTGTYHFRSSTHIQVRNTGFLPQIRLTLLSTLKVTALL